MEHQWLVSTEPAGIGSHDERPSIYLLLLPRNMQIKIDYQTLIVRHCGYMGAAGICGNNSGVKVRCLSTKTIARGPAVL